MWPPHQEGEPLAGQRGRPQTADLARRGSSATGARQAAGHRWGACAAGGLQVGSDPPRRVEDIGLHAEPVWNNVSPPGALLPRREITGGEAGGASPNPSGANITLDEPLGLNNHGDEGLGGLQSPRRAIGAETPPTFFPEIRA
ncbi:unnamed protein product [Prorocentrum cordatum]|uniref:Uncharacterized protein n=1 Tax=Prorocentrum cordatum TaxID=2364126 RepID=A0ABN9VPU2_9DINO|nr:unnamed protein product [Polarella glacialis]